MFLRHLSIHNYKSLRHVELQPQPLTCLVGPNASGKSNFADSLDFLSEVYRHGLEAAIARKGGFENIAFRKKRRSKAAIRFEIKVETGRGEDVPRFLQFGRRTQIGLFFKYTHVFSFAAVSRGIRAEFIVTDEHFAISVKQQKDADFVRQLQMIRDKSGAITFDLSKNHVLGRDVKSYLRYLDDSRDRRILGRQDLMVTEPRLGRPFTHAFATGISSFQVFRFSPRLSRTPGVPTPNPQLSTFGENLPALVDWLQRNHPKLWAVVMSGMRDIVPGLQRISAQYLHTKVLGLFFEEVGAGRPWIADDVSDGTIHALAMLVASVDPRGSLLCIEEPENSVHPWIIRTVVDRFREVSDRKTVILTTHSPILIDRLRPSEVWVVSRSKGETGLTPLLKYDPLLQEHWVAGKYRLSEALDSGLVPAAVPGDSQ